MIATEGPTFSVRVEPRGETTYIEVSGEVDLSTAPQLRDAIMHGLQAGPKWLVIDFARVDYLDSSGVHVLFECHRVAEERSAAMSIAAAPAHIRRVLEITGVTGVIDVGRQD